MRYYDEINEDKCPYISHIYENGDELLEIVIETTKLCEEKPLSIFNINLGSAREIVGTGIKYKIVFDGYISYAVLNESYSIYDEEEVYTGTSFRIYTKSKYLDYIRATSIVSEDYPDSYKHYCLSCLNHVVEIVSQNEPVIEKIIESH